jgi:hypothetical protein
LRFRATSAAPTNRTIANPTNHTNLTKVSDGAFSTFNSVNIVSTAPAGRLKL